MTRKLPTKKVKRKAITKKIISNEEDSDESLEAVKTIEKENNLFENKTKSIGKGSAPKMVLSKKGHRKSKDQTTTDLPSEVSGKCFALMRLN